MKTTQQCIPLSVNLNHLLDDFKMVMTNCHQSSVLQWLFHKDYTDSNKNKCNLCRCPK